MFLIFDRGKLWPVWQKHIRTSSANSVVVNFWLAGPPYTLLNPLLRKAAFAIYKPTIIISGSAYIRA